MDLRRFRWVRGGERTKNVCKTLRGFKGQKHTWVMAIYKLTARHTGPGERESAENTCKTLPWFKCWRHIWVMPIYKLTARQKRTRYKGREEGDL